ncbi:MAG: radical SAM protein [Methanimicrococcus sp.]|nr:radical SAM protein [Methanimicrococcus sp.]
MKEPERTEMQESERTETQESERTEMQEPVNVYGMPGLSVYMTRGEDGKIRLFGKGIFKFAAGPFLSTANKHLAAEKPAKTTENTVYPSAWLPPVPSPVFRRLVKAEIGTVLGIYVPETVSIEVTRKYNANAARSAEKHGIGNDDLPDPPEAQIKKAIDEALDRGAVVITFTEGDPMLNENIVEYVRYVDKERAVVMAYTWGLDFSLEKAERLKEAGLQTLLVSIYSTNPSEHDKKRGFAGAYDKAVEAIRNGLRAGLLVTMATHTDSNRIGELKGLWELAGELGVHEFSVWESVPNLKGEQMVSDDDRKTIVDFYKRVNASDDGSPRMFSNAVFEGEMFGMIAGRRWAHITTEGEVWPDPYIPLSYGSIKEEPFEKIWKKMRKEPAFRKKRRTHVLSDPVYLQKVRDAADSDTEKPE